MKTQTTKTNKRIFSLKTIVLLAVLAFSGFGFNAKAQNFTVNVDLQNTYCTTGWSIDVYDNSLTPVLLFSIPTISTGLNFYGCYPYTGTIGFIQVLRSTCSTFSFSAIISTTGSILSAVS